MVAEFINLLEIGMKKAKMAVMWAFIFSVLGSSTYAAWNFSGVQELLPKEAHAQVTASTSNSLWINPAEIKLYAVVLKKTVKETYKIGRHTRTRNVKYDEVCFVTKGFVDENLSKRGGKYNARGVDKWGLTYYRIKSKYQAEIRAEVYSQPPVACYVVHRPFWHWVKYFFGGGGGGGGGVS